MEAPLSNPHQIPHLELLDRNGSYKFQEPQKRINEGEDVQFFLTSKAYGDILAWILQLNASMFPRKSADEASIQAWQIGSSAVTATSSVQRIAKLLKELDAAIAEAPPDPGPRRFGNVSFRKWYGLVEERIDSLMGTCLKDVDSSLVSGDARKELKAYLLGGFGSVQRLDYGTGHELSFLAFLGGLWKLGFFEGSSDGSQERSIVLHAVEPYLELVRRLILTYNLEPAGSHGVWGLDDHAFAPYIFGSAQLGPAISDTSHIPQEGSLAEAPDPGDVAAAKVVERERRINMYFAAIGFIYDVKKGPFWEHSPMLFDISGVKAGWAKINKGMIKMYIAEVLSKFPVVQHFPFGQLFEWQRDPDAVLPATSTHVKAVPKSRVGQTAVPPSASGVGGDGPTTAPWSQNARVDGTSATAAAASARGPRLTMQQQQQRHGPGHGHDGQASVPGTVMTRAAGGSNVAVTKAPWAK